MRKYEIRELGKTILKNNHFVAVPAIIEPLGTITRDDGIEFLPAGTLVKGTLGTGATTPLEAAVVTESGVATDVASLASDGIGFLMNDVEFNLIPGSTTLRNGNGSVLIHGFVDVDKLPELGGVTSTETKEIYLDLDIKDIHIL